MNISIYGAHSASVTFQDTDGQYRIIELERLFKQRHFMLSSISDQDFVNTMREVLRVAKDCWGIENDFEDCVYGYNGRESHAKIIKNVINCKNVVRCDHHLAHAACAFYQSPFHESIVISFDGGGNDGVFNCYSASMDNGLQKLPFSSNYNLGHVYKKGAYPIREIKNQKGVLPQDLALAGKVMGLVAYGDIDDQLLPLMKQSYRKSVGYNSSINTIEGKEAYDLAATSQRAFEEIFFEVLNDLCEEVGPFENLCLTGGCALNVLLNDRIINEFSTNLFVPPNPDDSGLSLGQLLIHQKEKEKQNVVFNGLPILDKATFQKPKGREISFEGLAKYLSEGKIVGIIEGDSEVGPRALGHRSIVCDPSFLQMKDILNEKVKFREWFRPFAPVARGVDAQEYFEVVNADYSFMSFSPLVREKYREVLPSITHIDGSSRLQIVNDKDSTFYRILSEFERMDKPAVLLNTSFNIKGSPILSTYEDAFGVLESVDLDAVYFDGFIFEKHGE